MPLREHGIVTCFYSVLRASGYMTAPFIGFGGHAIRTDVTTATIYMYKISTVRKTAGRSLLIVPVMEVWSRYRLLGYML